MGTEAGEVPHAEPASKPTLDSPRKPGHNRTASDVTLINNNVDITAGPSIQTSKIEY